MSYQLKNLKKYFCIYCGKGFLRDSDYVKYKIKLGKNGPFCTKSCSGKSRKGEKRGAKKVWGPYFDKGTNRRYVLILKENRIREYKNYARYLMEEYLGKKLKYNETVDHINRDKLDDRLENLRVVSRSQHTYDDVKRAKDILCQCVICEKKFLRKGRDIKRAAKKKWAGPFCSRVCMGKYGMQRKYQNIKPLPPQTEIPYCYYQNEK